MLAAALITFSIISLGHLIVPTPDGIDTNDFESIKSNFHLFELKHFVFPLVAHIVGTFVASFLVSYLAMTHKLWFALGIGVLFMLVSLSLSIRIDYFNWIGIVEIAQYIPVSFMGYKFWQLTNSKSSKALNSK